MIKTIFTNIIFGSNETINFKKTINEDTIFLFQLNFKNPWNVHNNKTFKKYEQ